MGTKANAQYTITEIYEDISVVLSNDSHVFRADKDNVAIAGSTSIQVYGYQGSTQVSTDVGTITGLPSKGMTASVSNDATTNTTITISVTTALTSSVANNGVLTIPITVAGKIINKTFSWSKAQAGATGATGATGAQGYSVVGSITQPSLTESYWTTLGTVDSTHTWSNSATLGQQCRVGDIITIVGTATDTKNGHTIYAKVTGFDANGNITTKCLSRMVAERGAAGSNGTSYYTHIRYSNSSDGSNMSTDPSEKTYMGIYTGTSATAPTSNTSYTWSKFKGETGGVGPQGEQGFSIVGSVSRPNLTESQWNTYGTTGDGRTWSDTAELGAQCRIGDIVTIVGTATDTKNAHVIYGKINSIASDGDIGTTCIAHVVAERGPKGDTGATGPKGDGFELIVGTQTAATGVWTGIASFSSLTDGRQIAYWLPYNGSGNATLNLTLSNGTTTGAKNVYYQGTTRMTTHYPAGSVIHLTYRENATINGSSTKYTGWWGDANYTDGNTYDRLKYNVSIYASTAIKAGHLITGDENGFWPITSKASFDISQPILYAGSAIAAGSFGSNNYLSYGSFGLTTTQSGFSGATNASCYLKGTLQGTTFTLASGAFTTTVPTEEDGYTYILIGRTNNATSTTLYPEHPLYQFVDGSFRVLSQVGYEANEAAKQALQQATQALNNQQLTIALGENKYFYIEDGAESALKSVELFGESSQENSVQSTNLFDEQYYNNDSLYTSGTYKYTLAKITGNKTLYFKASLKEGKTAQTGAYIALSDSKGSPYQEGTKSIYAIRDGAATSQYIDFTGVNDLYINIYPNTLSCATIFDNYNLWVSTDDVAYESFVEKIPNPDSPSKIKSIGNKNIWDSSLQQGALTFAAGVFMESANYAYNTTKIPVVAGKTYTLSAKYYTPDSSSGFVFFKDGVFVSGQASTSLTVTVPAGANELVYNFHRNSLNISSLTEIQLEEGKVATPYAPPKSTWYKSEAKNIFNSEDWYLALSAINSTSMSKITVDGIAYYKVSPASIYDYHYMKGQFKENTQYVLTCKARKHENVTQESTGFRFCYTDGTNSNFYISNTLEERTYTLVSTAGKTIERIQLNYNYNNAVLIRDIQLEEGAQATPYNVYQNFVSIVPLDNPLNGLSTAVRDRIYKDEKTAKWFSEQKIAEYIITGNEAMTQQWGDAPSVFFITDRLPVKQNNNADYVGAISNYYSTVCYDGYTEGNSLWLIRKNNGYSQGLSINYLDTTSTFLGRIGIKDTRFTSLTAFQSHLKSLYAAGTPVVVQYELANPIITEITNLATIEALESIKTYLGTTHIHAEANNNIVYYRNTPFANLQQRTDTINSYLRQTTKELDSKVSSTTFDGKMQELDSQGNKIRDLENYRLKQEIDASKWQIQIDREKGHNLLQNSVMKRHSKFSDGAAASFWLNQDLMQNGKITGAEPYDDAETRSYTDSNSAIRFTKSTTSGATPVYCFSSEVPYIINKDHIFLSYKLRGNITSGTFFVGLVFYKRNNPDAATPGFSVTNNFINDAYYCAVREYDSTLLGGKTFTGDYVNKNIISREDALVEITETLLIDHSNGKNNVQLTYYPVDGVRIITEGLNAEEAARATITAIDNKKVTVSEFFDNSTVVTVRYNRSKNSYLNIGTNTNVANYIAQYGDTESIICHNSNSNLYVYNPMTGQYVLSTLTKPSSNMEINSVRVIIGMRPNSSGACMGEIVLSDLKLEYDTTSPYWTPNGNETYSKQYRMDEEGFSIASATNTMFIDEDEIAAYRNDDAGEVIEEDPVFQIKEENTILRQTTIREKLVIQDNDPNATIEEKEDRAFTMQQLNLGTAESPKWYFLFY